MDDPRFERTVILIIQHSSDGAVGIVINKPVGDTPIASVIEALGQKGGDVSGEVRVFSGGPVQPEVGFVVHSPEYRRPETVAVNDRLSMTSSVDILRDIGLKKGPAKILVAFGYAGWGPDQLEREIKISAWGIAEADPALIFDADRDKVWDYAGTIAPSISEGARESHTHPSSVGRWNNWRSVGGPPATNSPSRYADFRGCPTFLLDGLYGERVAAHRMRRDLLQR